MESIYKYSTSSSSSSSSSSSHNSNTNQSNYSTHNDVPTPMSSSQKNGNGNNEIIAPHHDSLSNMILKKISPSKSVISDGDSAQESSSNVRPLRPGSVRLSSSIMIDSQKEKKIIEKNENDETGMARLGSKEKSNFLPTVSFAPPPVSTEKTEKKIVTSSTFSFLSQFRSDKSLLKIDTKSISTTRDRKDSLMSSETNYEKYTDSSSSQTTTTATSITQSIDTKVSKSNCNDDNNRTGKIIIAKDDKNNIIEDTSQKIKNSKNSPINPLKKIMKKVKKPHMGIDYRFEIDQFILRNLKVHAEDFLYATHIESSDAKTIKLGLFLMDHKQLNKQDDKDKNKDEKAKSNLNLNLNLNSSVSPSQREGMEKKSESDKKLTLFEKNDKNDKSDKPEKNEKSDKNEKFERNPNNVGSYADEILHRMINILQYEILTKNKLSLASNIFGAAANHTAIAMREVATSAKR